MQALNAIAAGRGQSLAQMALAWTLRDARVTSTLLGASSVAQLEQNLGALEQPRVLAARSSTRSTAIAPESSVNIWAASSEQLSAVPPRERQQPARL